ncbi:MAG: ATP-dependent DNA helicase RecG [Roseinatronobacter sp.]
MAGRPEALFPLFAGLDTLPGIGAKTARLFGTLRIEKPRDVLFHLPVGLIDREKRESVLGAPLPATVTVEVMVGAHQSPRGAGPYRVFVRDAATEFTLVFFRANAKFLQAALPTGQRRVISGRLELFDNLLQMAHPDFILRPDQAADMPRFQPVYPLASGISAKLMARAVAGACARVPELSDWADPALVAARGWPPFRQALEQAHHPEAQEHLSPSAPARARLAYDECFAHQMTLGLARLHRKMKPGRSNVQTGALQAMVLQALPYTPTQAQQRVAAEIAADMAAPRRMNRLLQGDVGAGKTLVALLALLVAVEAGGQGVLMAPTEILARQHLENLRPLGQAAGLQIALLTGRDKGAERAAKLRDLAEGRLQIIIGTHAVFQKGVDFHDLRLVVIDEQHRFGVAQRAALSQKGTDPDILVMTATPIPRSLALAQFGDLDVSILDEKPPGRTPVQTVLVASSRMEEIIARLREALAQGRRAYWVCPLVEESELSALTAAEARFQDLRARFGEQTVGLVHGQLPPAEKDAAMARFVAGETQLLVATTVIEVGVNVPEASIMVIERAESFGLAQLHQLRGRVGRGAAASTCVLMYEPPLGETATRRLKLLRDTEDGFVIAEEDMAIRGAGDLIGTAQSGLPRFRIVDLEHQADLFEIAQKDARNLLEHDPTLSGPRGQAARVLLWLMEQDKAIRYLQIG